MTIRNRHNVYRSNTRFDGVIALVCLLAALFVAGLIATSDDDTADSDINDVTTGVTNPWP